MINIQRFWPGFLCLILLMGIGVPEAHATHIRGAEITAIRTSLTSLTYDFTLVAYRDAGSPVDFGDGIIEFGDGRIVQLDLEAKSVVKTLIGEFDEVEQIMIVIEHTFNSPGSYIISYIEPNRNDDIVNMDNSVNTRFYIETQILVDPFLGANSTPIMLVPPIDKAATGVRFIHNPGAFDPDGDSISYTMTIPKQALGQDVINYQPPNTIDYYLPPIDYNQSNQDMNDTATFTLDPLTGDLVWDAPGNEFGSNVCGEYNVAFLIEEWRKINGVYRRIGFVTRDMQIIVCDTENNPPEVLIPEDTCIVAGTNLEATVQGNDPDGDMVLLESFSGVYGLLSSPASYEAPPGFFPPIYQTQPGLLEFEWQTNCSHVRERPYQVQFKVTDSSTVNTFHVPLVDIKTWNVTVVAPAPVLTTADVASSNSIVLNWDDYSSQCSNPGVEIQVWRRVGSFDFTPEGCLIGIPEGSGYELVGMTEVGSTSFVDDNNGDGLNEGATYCYRLVAVFPAPGGGVSYASNEICATIELSGSVLTNVDILETDISDGEILVKWTTPINVDAGVFPPPYSYNLYRSNGFDGDAGEQLIASDLTDTTFLDQGPDLNTKDQVFNYRVELFDASNTLVDASARASTVRADAASLTGAIEITWSADVPWSINTQSFPIHKIYRDNILSSFPDSLVFVADIAVPQMGFVFFDDGSLTGGPLSDETEYCYYVETFGSYENPAIAAPLINKSQIVCAQPSDSIPPCTPILSLEVQNCEEFLLDKPCNFSDFSNTISWTRDPNSACDDDIRSFNIYYSRSGEEESFTLVGNVIDNFFVHRDLPSFAGCYQVASVDRSGNESARTEILCIDNCPNYYLPNVFGPEAVDNFNNRFRAYFGYDQSFTDYAKCPRFVESVNLTIVNRWGKEVFQYDSEDDVNEGNILIEWDGRDHNGNPLPAGTYYYTAVVTYDVLDPQNATEKIKGWVDLLRGNLE